MNSISTFEQEANKVRVCHVRDIHSYSLHQSEMSSVYISPIRMCAENFGYTHLELAYIVHTLNQYMYILLSHNYIPLEKGVSN